MNEISRRTSMFVIGLPVSTVLLEVQNSDQHSSNHCSFIWVSRSLYVGLLHFELK